MGYGDEIMTTGYVKEIKKKYPNHQIVIGSPQKKLIYYSDIFKNNPNITIANKFDLRKKVVWVESFPRNRPYILSKNEKQIIWNMKHRSIKGEFYFDKKEKTFANNIIQKFLKNWNDNNSKKFKKIIFIETSRKAKIKKHGLKNRDWGIENWIKFVDKYKKDYLFLQSIHKDSKIIKNIYSFKSDFRQACAVMSHCDIFLGWEGGFVQAAAALDKKALVLFGGWAHPSVTGYNFHKNIYIDIDKSPCGMLDDCEHCKKCRKLMNLELVCSKFEEII